MKTPDRPRRSEPTRQAILQAARVRFATDGYDRATIRAIAADAGIDPSLVMRYFGSKEQLFVAATDFDLHTPDLAASPPQERGARLVRHFIRRMAEVRIPDQAASQLAPAGVAIARAEGFELHAESMEARMRENPAS